MLSAVCRSAEHGAALDEVALADEDLAVGAADPRMRFDHRVVADDDIALDDAERSDLGRGCNLSIGGNDGSGVNSQTCALDS